MEIKRKNKRGVFFSILAITLLSLFLASYTIYSAYSTFEKRESVNKRIETMNNFVSLIENDLPRQLYISGFRIVFLFENEILEKGTYIENINSSFQELFFNGTIKGIQKDLMYGVTLDGIVDSLNQRGRKMNLKINITSPEISIMQEDPWNIKIILKGELTINDKENLAYWNRTYFKEVYIPIENFEDPIYIINTNGLVTSRINKTDRTFSYENLTNLSYHLENSLYSASTLAPSFLDRLEGKTSPNPNGIESLVYLPKLSQQGIPIKEKSVVDYIYFSNENPPYYGVKYMPSWFKLDETHLDFYKAEKV